MSCVAELPDLVQVARESKGVDVLLVSFDLQLPKADRSTVAARVEKFIEERKWGLPSVVIDPAAIEALNERFDLPGGIPVTLAFDKFGHVVDREDGACEKARFVELAAHAR